MIRKSVLINEYVNKRKSASEVAVALGVSERSVRYFLVKYEIPRRSISDAIYIKNNPQGDPFKFTPPTTNEDWELYGMGMGLYWGEGTKANMYAVRLGNSDPDLTKVFIKFLIRFYKIDKKDLRFGIQIFSDMSVKKIESWWISRLDIKESQLYKTQITNTNKKGTYKNKQYAGVITLYYNNKKMVEDLKLRLSDCKIKT